MSPRSESEHKYKIFFVFVTSFYLRKLPRDGRIIFQQTRRILVQQNTEIVQRLFFPKKRKFHFLKNSRGRKEAILITMLLIFCLKFIFFWFAFLLTKHSHSFKFFVPSCWTSLHLEYSFNNPGNFCHQNSKVFAASMKLIVKLFFFLHM